MKLDPDEVRIIVKDGLIQDVQVGSNVLNKVKVRSFDYDAEETDQETVQDENGTPCHITKWRENHA